PPVRPSDGTCDRRRMVATALPTPAAGDNWARAAPRCILHGGGARGRSPRFADPQARRRFADGGAGPGAPARRSPHAARAVLRGVRQGGRAPVTWPVLRVGLVLLVWATALRAASRLPELHRRRSNPVQWAN